MNVYLWKRLWYEKMDVNFRDNYAKFLRKVLKTNLIRTKAIRLDNDKEKYIIRRNQTPSEYTCISCYESFSVTDELAV